MTATAIAPVAERQGFLYRDLVSDKLWERLVGRVVKDEGVERLVAEQIVDAGLGFVKLIADHPGHSFAPSPMVDIGWHTLILYTRHYAALCQQLAGRFIHHEPNDDPDNPSTAGGPRAHGGPRRGLQPGGVDNRTPSAKLREHLMRPGRRRPMQQRLRGRRTQLPGRLVASIRSVAGGDNTLPAHPLIHHRC